MPVLLILAAVQIVALIAPACNFRKGKKPVVQP
jgi:hypothetical protein